jgi:hypothetical protein
MRRFCGPLVLSRLGLGVALLSLLASHAGASPLPLDNIGLYDGTSNSPTAVISFTGSGNVDVYADPQTATNWTYSNHSLIPLYCTDTTHENTLGVTYNTNQETPPPTFSTQGRFTDAGNRVAWLLGTYLTPPDIGQNAAQRGAAQLLIWYIVDKNFSVQSFSSTALQTDYNNLITTMSTSYNPSTNYYPEAIFLGAVHNGSLYQDMALATPPPGSTHPNIVTPEPATCTLAGLSLVCLIPFQLWRRRVSAC